MTPALSKESWLAAWGCALRAIPVLEAKGLHWYAAELARRAAQYKARAEG